MSLVLGSQQLQVTNTGGVPEASDGLEDSTTDDTHREGTTTVINNAPGTVTHNRDCDTQQWL